MWQRWGKAQTFSTFTPRHDMVNLFTRTGLKTYDNYLLSKVNATPHPEVISEVIEYSWALLHSGIKAFSNLVVFLLIFRRARKVSCRVTNTQIYFLQKEIACCVSWQKNSRTVRRQLNVHDSGIQLWQMCKTHCNSLTSKPFLKNDVTKHHRNVKIVLFWFFFY